MLIINKHYPIHKIRQGKEIFMGKEEQTPSESEWMVMEILWASESSMTSKELSLQRLKYGEKDLIL